MIVGQRQSEDGSSLNAGNGGNAVPRSADGIMSQSFSISSHLYVIFLKSLVSTVKQFIFILWYGAVGHNIIFSENTRSDAN